MTEQIAELEERVAERLVNISRAYGGLVATYTQAQRKVILSHAAQQAVEARADCFKKLRALRAEANALCHRFALAMPALPRVSPPAGVSGWMPEGTEQCEHGLRERRTYTEVKDSEGYALILHVGLVPWPPLTERQEQMVDARARQAREEARQMSGMEQIASVVRATPHMGSY